MCSVHLHCCCGLLSDLFIKCSDVHKIYTRSSIINFFVNPSRTCVRRSCLAVSGPILWNKLNYKLHECTTLSAFKSLLKITICDKYA